MSERPHERDPAHWDARYAARAHDHSADSANNGHGGHGASGERRPAHGPSEELVATLDGVAPGRALDLGAGTGRHAVWLGRDTHLDRVPGFVSFHLLRGNAGKLFMPDTKVRL